MESSNSTAAGMPAQSSKAGIIVVSVGLLIVGLVVGYLLGSSGSGDVTYQTPTTTPSTSVPIGWEVYRNDTYGFEIQYIGALDSGNTIRMQNYVASDDPGGLKPGEYYLEVLPLQQSCEKDVVGAKRVSVHGATVAYQGTGEPGGDSGGIPFVVCANKGNLWVLARATENSDEGQLAKQILSTLRFTAN